MTLIALAVAYVYLFEPRRRVRYVLTLLMIPIAIVTNAIRILGAGMLAHRYGPATAEGFLHGFSGWLIFVSALVLMFLCHWILGRIVKTEGGAIHA
jgi:exosortase/archaeosortase family protein